MAKYKIIQEDLQHDTHQYIIDDDSSLEEVPKHQPGSVVISLATCSVYVLNTEKIWVKL